MAYRVRLFDNLIVPDYVTPVGSHNMGTGNALTSFLPLPGGGYYDNYRDLRSPQGIRPITVRSSFVGTQTLLREQIQSWRALLGERRRLTVEYDDGLLVWQWARLQNVEVERGPTAIVSSIPVVLTWITAAQNWRGVVYGEPEWTWGDDSWVFGDGSAAMGVGAVTFDLASADETVTVTQEGDIDAPNVTLRFDISGTWQDLTVINETTGQQIIIERDAPAATPGVEIDASARSIYLLGSEVAISSISRDRDGLEVDTVVAHGLVTGDTVRIAETDVYDGDYYYIGSTPPSNFSYTGIPANPRSYGTVGSGIVRKLTDAYGVTTFTDKANWLVLAPGDNILRIVWSTFPTSASLTVEFVDHYA